jgi:DnaJ-class molecular chaperone
MIWGHSVRMHTNQSPEPPAVNQAMGQVANGAGQAAAGSLSQHLGQTVAGKPCQHCGGSGILRKNSESYRTCLVCLGQGVPPSSKGLVFSLIRPVSSPAASR